LAGGWDERSAAELAHRAALGEVDVARLGLTASAHFTQLHSTLHQSADRGTARLTYIQSLPPNRI